MEGLSLSVHLYFLLDDPLEKLLTYVGLNLCRTHSSMSCSILASFPCNALSNGTELFKECSDSHVHMLPLFYTANSRVW